MATASRGKRATRSTTASKSATPAPASTKAQRGAAARDAQLEQVRDLLDQGKTVSEIMAKLKIGTGKAAFLAQMAKVPESDLFKWKTEDQLKTWIVKARTQMGLSWGLIMIRAGISEAKARKLFREAGNEDRGHRVGKGGRLPGGAKPAPKKGSARTGRKTAAAKSDDDAAEPQATAATSKAKARVRRRTGSAQK